MFLNILLTSQLFSRSISGVAKVQPALQLVFVALGPLCHLKNIIAKIKLMLEFSLNKHKNDQSQNELKNFCYAELPIMRPAPKRKSSNLALWCRVGPFQEYITLF